MGKSFSKEKRNYGEKSERSTSSDFKRRRNQIKEEHAHDEDHSDYKIHGFNRNKSRY